MKEITIIGGGLAGLTLGIALRERDVPVKIVEAGSYPRHRVCGEFISGDGLKCLRELGLLQAIEEAGTQVARDAAFFGHCHPLWRRDLPSPALSISRFVLDAALARRFRDAGGELRTDERCREEPGREGVVSATGRRPSPTRDGFRWFGLKVHARDVPLDADLEMHLHGDAYVGLCRLPGGEVNVCGLFRRRVEDRHGGDPMQWLRGERGSLLHSRLEHARVDPGSFCSVAGLSFQREPIDDRHCRVGDALTMIPPVTGNGMSMAFESAWLALDPLLCYARQECGWAEATATIAQLLSHRFRHRLLWAGVLHRLMFSRVASPGLTILRVPILWRAAFALTR